MYDANDEEEIQTDCGNDADDEENKIPTKYVPQNHRQGHRTHMAKADSLCECGATKLKGALRSGHCEKSLIVIAEKFDAMREPLIPIEGQEVPSNREFLLYGANLELKRNSEEKFLKLKARLHMQENTEIIQNFVGLCALVASIELERVMLAVSMSFGLIVDQVDVKGLFLNADLQHGDHTRI